MPAGRVELVHLFAVGTSYVNAPGAPQLAATDPAVVDGNTLTLRFDRTLAPFTKVAGTGGFSVSGAASTTAVTHVEGHPTTVALTLDREVGSGETGITLSYEPGTPSIRNLHNEAAGGFASQAVANARADTTAPALVTGASTIAGTDVRLRFSEGMDPADPKPAGSQFVLSTGTGGTDLGTVTLASIDGSVVRLSTQNAATATDVVTLTVTDTSNIRDLAGNAMATVSGFALTNTGGTAPGGPALAATGPAVLEGNVLALTFDQTLDPASVPPASAFSVSGGRPAAIVDAVAVDGARALLTLRTAMPGGTRRIAVSYTAGQGLRNLWGEAASGIDGQAVRVAGPDVVAPAVVRVEVHGAELKLHFDEALDAASAPPGTAFGLYPGLVAGTGTAAIEDKVVTVTLAEAGRSWREVWYAAPGAGGKPLQDAAGNKVPGVGCFVTFCTPYGWGPPRLVSGMVSGQSVTLRFSEALDESSVPEAKAFSVTVDDTAVTPGGIAVTGVEVSMELPSAAGPDAVVKVGFSDASGIRDLSGTEARLEDGPYTLTNLAAAGPAPLTASFHGLPAAHDGKKRFAFELRLSEAVPGLKLSAVESALTVTGGRLIDVKRTVRGKNDSVTVRVRPASTGDMTVALAATTDCAAAGAICMGGGRKLENAVSATVTGPAGLTAAFHGMPAAHDGARRFGFEIRFSEAVPGLKLSAVESALQVTGGRLIDVKRTVRGKNGSVTVRVRPDSTGAVVVALAATTDCAAASAICARGGRKLAAVTATVPGPVVNAPATGAPTIAGTARVGETLTASTAGIADADGLTGASFAFQWVSVRDGADADIAGATASTYKLVRADAGATIKVRVSFTDDAGNAETLTSAATAAVALPPLTAAFHGMPAEHDGAKRFEFEVRFSEEVPGLRLTAVQAALQVTNGRVAAVKRAVAGQIRRVTVQVRPSGVDDVTVSLPATTDCTAAAAICASDGRMLSSAVSATVRGPVALSVADARANEADAAVEFAVSLSRAASGTVTVGYATRDGTAKAGEDFTFTRGTLTFAAGDLTKTVSVPLLDDAIDEGEETFTLKLMNAVGAAIGDGEATGTIENADPLQKMWLSRFGRTVADHVTSAVSDRLSKPLSGAQVTVGGQSVNLAAQEDHALLTQTLTSVARAMGAPSGPASGGEDDGFPESGPGQAGTAPWPGTGLGPRGSPTLDAGTPDRLPEGRELLLGSAFHLATDGDGSGPGLAAWGRVTVGGFDGEAPADKGDVRIDGNVTTGILGADAEWNRLLAGVAISVSEGEGSFDQPGIDKGSIESTMTTVSPYARFTVNDRLSVWGLAGWGTGDMTIVQDARAAADGKPARPERISRTDLGMRLAALGGRGALLTQDEGGGFDLALRADAFWVETEADPVSDEGTTTAQASRVRLALEGSRAFRMEGGGTLTPGLELGLRHDGGDAETGTGVELGGRVSWTDLVSGLSVEAMVRTLIAHEDSDYREWGASGTIRFDPGVSGQGLSFHLAPTYGTAASGVDRLWSARDAGGLAPGEAFEAERRLAGELGYGLELPGGFTGTPNVGFGLSDTARDWRVGWRLTSVVPNDSDFEVSLDATRREPVGGNGAGAPVEHGVMLRGAVRW